MTLADSSIFRLPISGSLLMQFETSTLGMEYFRCRALSQI